VVAKAKAAPAKANKKVKAAEAEDFPDL
jgi:hypothetical protein